MESKLNKLQMGMIKDGLTIEQVKVYANPEFSWRQMEEIKKGFKNGLTIDQVKFYADYRYDYYQMQTIRERIEKRLPI